jgi:hypothetical protein
MPESNLSVVLCILWPKAKRAMHLVIENIARLGKHRVDAIGISQAYSSSSLAFFLP